MFRTSLAVLAVVRDRLGHHEAAATVGDQTYESQARKGETMTTAAIVTYTNDQIDQARTDLNAVSK